jgi:hypothetical protein
MAGLAALLLVVMLYVFAPTLYGYLMAAMIKVPAPHPFTDFEWVPSAVLCWSRGVDVYLNNTCYFEHVGLGFNYSPLWLRLSFLKTLGPWTNPLAILLCVLFLVSPAILPVVRSAHGQALLLLTTLSCATFLAMERANMDLVIYLIVLCAVLLTRHNLPVRITGYGLIIFAALLKFYPIVALVLACRERLLILVLIGFAAIASLAALVALFPQELLSMARSFPRPSYYTLQFGAVDLPIGLVATVRAYFNFSAVAYHSLLRPVELLLRAFLPIMAATAAFYVAWRLRLVKIMTKMDNKDTDSLVAGATIICGCFFLINNVIYRGIFLLLVMPGLLLLEKQVQVTSGARLIRGVCIAVCFVLWTPFLESLLRALNIIQHRLAYQTSTGPDSAPAYILWLSSELAWWTVVTMLLAVVGAFVFASRTGTALQSKLGAMFGNLAFRRPREPTTAANRSIHLTNQRVAA